MTHAAYDFKILHLVHAFRLGGMENGVVNLTRSHASIGIAHEICSLTNSDSFRERLHPSVPLFELNKSEGFSPSTVLALSRLVNARQPQVLHAHNYAGMIYGGLVSLATGIPLCLGEHASLRDWEKTPWRVRLRKFLYEHWISGGHAVSRDLAIELNSSLFEDEQCFKIRPIVNGVDTERFQIRDAEETKLRLGLDPTLKTVGIAARLARSKGHEFLFRVFQSMRDVGDPVQLLMVGSSHGEEARQILDLMEGHPDREHIHYLGSRDDMEHVYPAMEVMVLPSTSEGLSNACLEAMACGVPVVTYDNAGAREILPDPGLGSVLSEFEILPWAFEIRKVMAKGEQEPQWRESLRGWIVGTFSLARMSQDYAAFYAECVEQTWQRKGRSL